MSIYTIYKCTNKINGKSYIGFDSKYPKRIKDHKTCHLNLKCKSYNSVFYKSLRKYGWDNFTISIIYQSKDKLYTKNIMENDFIIEYNTFVNSENSMGYNMTIGGDGVLNASDFWSKERKLKQSLISKERFTRILKTQRHKENMKGSRSHVNQTGKNNNAAQKLSTPYGVFDSIKEAEFYFNEQNINITYSKIFSKLNNPNKSDWFYINKKYTVKSNTRKIKNNCKTIQTPYGIFNSMKDAIQYIKDNMGVHMSYDILKNKLRNTKFNEWNYLYNKGQ
jgi:group I intron endonuclease